MDWLITVALVVPCVAAGFTSYSSSSDNPSDTSFIEAGEAPACPADLFDEELVRASCYQGEKPVPRLMAQYLHCCHASCTIMNGVARFGMHEG